LSSSEEQRKLPATKAPLSNDDTKPERDAIVSSIHAYPDAFDRLEPASARLPIAAIESLRIAVTGRAARLIAGLQHRRTMQRIACFSDHSLQDMGSSGTGTGQSSAGSDSRGGDNFRVLKEKTI
jgi:hypothetical protein